MSTLENSEIKTHKGNRAGIQKETSKAATGIIPGESLKKSLTESLEQCTEESLEYFKEIIFRRFF